jgi:hypothetical protein
LWFGAIEAPLADEEFAERLDDDDGVTGDPVSGPLQPAALSESAAARKES